MKKYYKLLTKKLFLTYFIYITLFSVLAYSFCLIYTRNSYVSQEQQRTEQLVANFENYLTNSKDIAVALSHSDTIREFAAIQIPDHYLTHRVQDELSSVGIINNSYQTIALFNTETDNLVTSAGSMSLTYFNQCYGLEADTLNATFAALGESGNKNRSACAGTLLTSSTGDASYLFCCFASDIEAQLPSCFVAVYDLNVLFDSVPAPVLPSIMRVTIEKDNLYMCYDTANGSAISFLPNETEKNLKTVATIRHSSNFLGTVSATTSVKHITFILYINSFFALFALFLLVILFLLHLLFKNNAKQLYSPIMELVSKLPPLSVSDSQSEFDAINTYINSLASQKNAMSVILSENHIHLREKFIIQTINGTLTRMQIKEGLLQYELDNVKFPSFTFIVYYNNFSTLQQVLSYDGLNDLRLSLHDYFKLAFEDADFFHLSDIDQQTFAGIIACDDTDKLKNQLKHCLLNIEMLFEVDMSVLVGTAASSWYELPASYASILDIKDKISTASQSLVIFADDIAENTASPLHYPPETENRLIAYVMAGDSTNATDCVNKIIDANMTDETVFTHEQAVQFSVMLYSTITKLLTNINKTEKELFAPTSIYLELIGSANASTLKATMMSFINTIISQITSTHKNTESSTKEHIIAYIQDNYAENISLYTLADYLNVSQSYASKIFKSNLGENFKDYLVTFRLTKAIELMTTNPGIRIREVAHAVGYTTDTFTRTFRKKYGLSPHEYMTQVRAAGETTEEK